MHPAHAALTIACNRCGGIVSLAGGAPRIRCPYCANEQAVSKEKLAELARYQRAAGDLVDRIGAEEGQRAQWERWYGPDGASRSGYVAPVAIFGAMAAVYAISIGLAGAHVIDGETLARVLPVGTLGVFFVSMGGYIAFKVRRVRRTGSPAPRVGAQCPRCGGPLAFEAGKATERCGHCGASLVADTATLRETIDVARADLRRAAMARYRVERSAMAAVYRSSASNVIPYVVLGSFLPLTAGIAVAFSIDSLTSSKSDTPVAGLAVIWLFAIVNTGAIAIIAKLRKAQRDRWRAVASATAARLGGHVSTSTDEWVSWLNTLWAGPYAITNLFKGRCFHAVTGHLAAYGVAIDIDPIPASSDHGAPRLDVLVAACLPGDAESVAPPSDIVERARALGFTPSSCAGGFITSGSLALARTKGGDPAAVADVLVRAATLLVEWATRVGATAAAPITH